MKVYVVRHGETDWNLENRLQGANDVPLNEHGIRQAEETREVLKDYDFDVIFSSPYKRAAMTARIINADRQLPVFFDNRLRERSFGVNEGKHWGTFDYPAMWDYDRDESFGGESCRDFLARVSDFLDELEKFCPDKNVLLVCHGGTIRGVECHYHGIIKDPKEMAAFLTKNGAIREYEK